MDVVLKDEVRTARKEYRCDAYDWWRRCGLSADDCATEDQRQALAQAQIDGGKIEPGEKYRYIRGVHEGAMCTWRERLDTGALCRDLDLYDNG